MAVKMRLMRMGKTKSPHYRVVVMDGRAPRDGRYIDQIGRYDPRQDPSLVEIDAEKAVDWLRKGAQPTEAVSKILDIAGALTQFKVKSGRIHTVGGSAPDAAAEAESEPDEAPAGETPSEEAASEETPSEDKSSEEAPAGDAPVDDAADSEEE